MVSQDKSDQIQDIRTSMLLEGLKTRLPEDFNADSVLTIGSQNLSRYMGSFRLSTVQPFSSMNLQSSITNQEKLKEVIDSEY